MIDSHCHLADRKFNRDLDAVIERARVAGVSPVVTIADSFRESKQCIEIANRYEDVYCTVGMHPHHAKHWKEGDEETLKKLVASSAKVKAIGEIGLDYHYDNSPRDVQRTVFRRQLVIANELKMPAVIHNRESIGDFRKIVSDVKPMKAVLHCCTDRWEDVEQWVADGYLLSFTGVATYPQSEHIRETIKNCPIEQLMVETDAPYLAPVPHRGKRNEPSFVVEVAKLVSKLKAISLEEVDAITTRNALDFYGISAPARLLP